MTYKLTIEQDEWSESPREWNEFSTMVCVHRRYTLGDEQLTTEADTLEDAFSIHLADNQLTNRDIIYLPIYLYDHSGISISTTPFSCSWDSGKVGYIYVSKAKLREEYSTKRISPKRKQDTLDQLASEVKVYNTYLQGDVYSFTLDTDSEHVDSCGGFYGSEIDINMLEHLPTELHEQIKQHSTNCYDYEDGVEFEIKETT